MTAVIKKSRSSPGMIPVKILFCGKKRLPKPRKKEQNMKKFQDRQHLIEKKKLKNLLKK